MVSNLPPALKTHSSTSKSNQRPSPFHGLLIPFLFPHLQQQTNRRILITGSTLALVIACVLVLASAQGSEAKGYKEKKIHVVHVPKPVYIKKPVPVYLEKKVPVVKIKPIYVPKPIIVKKKEFVPVIKKVHIIQKVKVPVIKKVPVPYPVKKIKVSGKLCAHML